MHGFVVGMSKGFEQWSLDWKEYKIILLESVEFASSGIFVVTVKVVSEDDLMR